MSLDRKDYKTAIPQLEKRLNELGKVQENALARFDTITDALARQADANARYMANQVLRINGDLADLQNQVDGNITTWFYAYAPTLSNYPADEWVDAGTENVHLGDLFYDTSTGYVYRFMSDGQTPPTYSWLRITDSDVTRALANAQHAQDTADGKRRVFVVQPTPPYDVGDLWCEGLAGDILTCTTAKDENGSYSSSDWTKLNKYTDDTEALKAQLLANNAQTSADGKNTIYYSEPTQGTVLTIGDTWFKAEEDNAIYRWSGTAWVKEEFGEDAIADLAITNAKIADATIQSAKIGSVDVSTLTGGYISGQHINASELTIGGSHLATQSDIDGIEIGARNLVLGTGSPQEITIRSGTNITEHLYYFSDYAFGDGRLLYFNESGYACLALFSISFDWETTDTTGTFYLQTNNTPWRNLMGTAITVTAENQSGHVEYTHPQWASSSTTLTATGLCVRTDDMTADETLTISNLKIELGNKATDWTPAPEDIDASLDGYKIGSFAVGGDIVSFEGSGLPLVSANTTLNPIQDLNGYDAPWVGGAGKNVCVPFEGTKNGIVRTLNDDGTVAITGKSTANSWSYLEEYYDLPYCGIDVGDTISIYSDVYIVVMAYNGSTSLGSKGAKDGNSATYTIPADTTRLRILQYPKSVQPVIDEVFNTTAKFWVSKSAFSSWEPYENICPISGHDDVTVTVADDVDNPTVSETYTTTLPSTTYGGTLDLISGELTVTHGIVDLSTLSWTWSSNYSSHYAGLSGSVGKPNNQVANCIAEKYATDTVSNVLANVGRIGIASNATPPRVWVSTGAQATTPTGNLVYELATPQTYQLTAQQVDTLVGTNNVWSNADGVSVIYINGGEYALKQLDASSAYLQLSENRTEYKLNEDYATKKALSDVETFAKEYIGDTGYIAAKNGELAIGNGDAKLSLTAAAMLFYDGGSPVASMSNKELIIDRTRVSSIMRMGNFAWAINPDNRLILKYIGT